MTITDLGISAENHHHDGNHHHTTTAFPISISPPIRNCGVCRFGEKDFAVKIREYGAACENAQHNCMIKKLHTLNPKCFSLCRKDVLRGQGIMGIDGVTLSVVPLRSKSNRVDFL